MFFPTASTGEKMAPISIHAKFSVEAKNTPGLQNLQQNKKKIISDDNRRQTEDAVFRSRESLSKVSSFPSQMHGRDFSLLKAQVREVDVLMSKELSMRS